MFLCTHTSFAAGQQLFVWGPNPSVVGKVLRYRKGVRYFKSEGFGDWQGIETRNFSMTYIRLFEIFSAKK